MIFNKDTNGDAELKKVLGFTSASIAYTDLEPFMELALRELLLVVPKEVYQQADEYYNTPAPDPDAPPDDTPPDPDAPAEPSTEDLDRLVLLCQTVMAFHAYRRYAPSNDLTHSDTGRQMYVSEGEKPAWEWMIDKDDRNLLELAWDHTDVLLGFLTDKSFTTWTNSTIYKESLKRFISSCAEFNSYFNINNSFRVYFMFIPTMANSEMNIIRSCFKPQVWSGLLADMSAGTLSDQEKEYVRLAKECIPFYAIAEAVSRFQVEVLPEGIFKNAQQGRTSVNQKLAADIMDRGQAITFYSNMGDRKLKALQREIARVDNLANNVNDTSSMFDKADEKRKFLRF